MNATNLIVRLSRDLEEIHEARLMPGITYRRDDLLLRTEECLEVAIDYLSEIQLNTIRQQKLLS